MNLTTKLMFYLKQANVTVSRSTLKVCKITKNNKHWLTKHLTSAKYIIKKSSHLEINDLISLLGNKDHLLIRILRISLRR